MPDETRISNIKIGDKIIIDPENESYFVLVEDIEQDENKIRARVNKNIIVLYLLFILIYFHIYYEEYLIK